MTGADWAAAERRSDLAAGAEVVGALLAGAPVGFALYDTERRYLQANEVFARTDGLRPDDYPGRRPSELLGDFGALIEERLSTVLASGDPLTVEDTVRDATGAKRFWSTSWYPARDLDGRLVGVIVVALDVTDRVLAEQRLRRSEARYRSLVQASALDVWRTDAAGNLADDMPAWRDITGQDAPALLGTGWLAGVHPDDRARVWETWRASVASVSPYVCEYRIGAPQRGWRTVVARGLPIVEDGEVMEWVGTTLDVTEFRDAEAARTESYNRIRAAALTLQRSILPEQTMQPEELEVAARYVPGVADTEVGGDWYDVIELGAGRIGLVIGDVMGRGIRAAAVMGQLRTAVRAYSRLDLPPGELLAMLDGLVAEFSDQQIVTCVYAMFDPGTRELTLANAGHVPPLLVRGDGRTVLLDHAVGAPLGVGTGVYQEERIRLQPGEVLALYTDGLVERREIDIDAGIARLATAFALPAAPLDVLCDSVLQRLDRQAGHEDDVALLVVRLPADTDAGIVASRLDVPRGIRSVSEARSFCLRLFAGWRLPAETAEAALLVVNELVTNALVHGRSPVELQLRRTRTRLYVEVTDASGHLPRRRQAGAEDEGGRGLQLVASLSERWGVRPVGDGKSVWAALSIPGVGAAAVAG